ncbi:methionine--tRNA ligase subunit beta [Granulicella sp. 5B5]|uniref:methionine--tRNA ligase subunit beta n=1 Tax=Granulicella sp. 5B5 TaxID=1617967 RepID=UPI0015F39762|nr:methionine--tRNA ligase subunit beta [Granulicella sp. 5B5]QMV17790.1 methionine--tRNA ligase subunit beta [Granulicella sp. 5B5]
MPDQPKTFYLTTPIYYVNARPHIGHAYSTIVADVLARRHRLLGDETYFLTGTDEHGQKIERSAAAAGIPPQQFADQVSATFRALWNRMGITYNDYIRTTEPRHKIGVQQLFRTLYNNGHIYLDSYTGAYCVSDEAFVDAPIGTPCPDCGKLLEEVTEENFFFRLSAFQQPLLDLIESNQLVITPDAARNEVLSFIRGNTNAATTTATLTDVSSRPQAERSGDAVERPASGLATSARGTTYVPGALKDLSISRSSFTWGIPVPDDIQRAAGTKQNHVVYVWLDALANYMTALGYGSADDALWQKFWPADLHLVGKEITRFHCVYWPAFLIGLNSHWKPDPGGDPHKGELILEPDHNKLVPKQVTANGWLLFDNSKMSKSKGNVVRAETILDAFGTLCPPPLSSSTTGISPSGGSSGLQATESGSPNEEALAPGLSEPTPHDRDLFAADVLRYYLLREIPFGQDGSFSFDTLITRYNADLANGYGNLVSRALNMIQLYRRQEVPNHEVPTGSENWHSMQWLQYFCKDNPGGNYIPEEESGKPEVSHILNEVRALHSFLEIQGSLIIPGTVGRIQALIALTDRYLSYNAPWKLAKIETPEARKQLDEVLYNSAESIRIITALLYPILPHATARVWQQLGLGDIEQAARNGELTNLQWGGLQPGTKLGPLGPIFPRADKGLAQTMIDNEEKLAAQSSQPTAQTQTPSQDPSSPAAPPRTTTLPEPAGTLPVAGSTAHTTGPEPTPAPLASRVSPLESQEITIDDFAKVELRIAEVKVCERIPKADKLLRLEVDLGPLGQRQILSGIAEFYTPEELIGRRIIVITNLAPRKMRGLESHGMLLAASEEGGKPYLATVPEGVPVGTRLK